MMLRFCILFSPSFLGKYSGLTNAESCRLYRQSMTQAKKNKERLRKQNWRNNLKKDKAKYAKYLENERNRKMYSKLKNSVTQES